MPAAQLLNGLTVLASIADRTFGEYGFQLNFKKGKSEALVQFMGSGAQAAQRKLSHELCNSVTFVDARGEAKVLHTTFAYKHVGTMTTVSGTMNPEIVMRMSSLRSTMIAVQRPLLKQPRVHENAKISVTKALLLTRGLFQAGAWPSLTVAEAKKVHAPIMQVYRRIAACRPYTFDREWPSDDDLVEKLGVSAPKVLLCTARLLLLLRVLRAKPIPVLVALAYGSSARRSWISAVRADVSFMCRHSDKWQHLAQLPFEKVLEVFAADIKSAKRMVLAASSDPAVNARKAWASSRAEREMGTTYACAICVNTAFPSRQQLALHLFKKHSQCRVMRQYVDCDYCVACMQHFSSQERVVCHLEEKSARCKAFYVQVMEPLSPESQRRADEASKAQAMEHAKMGLRRAHASRSVVRLHGPLHATAMDLGISHSALLRCKPTGAGHG
eukprot:7837488-Karenia_brevis.AAC.1